MNKKIISKIKTSCTGLLLVVSIFSYTQLNASYKSTNINESTVSVAKFGELKLIEKSNLDPNYELIINNETKLQYSDIRSGENIEKSFHVEYKSGEVPTYIFFTLYMNDWQYSPENNALYLLNKLGDNYLMALKMVNDDWNLLKSEKITKDGQEVTGYIYYKEVEANQDVDDILIDKINVNLISSNDIKYLDGKSSIGIGAYAISKQGLIITPSAAWDVLKLKI